MLKTQANLSKIKYHPLKPNSNSSMSSTQRKGKRASWRWISRGRSRTWSHLGPRSTRSKPILGTWPVTQSSSSIVRCWSEWEGCTKMLFRDRSLVEIQTNRIRRKLSQIHRRALAARVFSRNCGGLKSNRIRRKDHFKSQLLRSMFRSQDLMLSCRKLLAH